jgi:hypothetical protein
MQQHLDSAFPPHFHRFIAKTCILLFFLVLASKSGQLLITDKEKDKNQFQREFLFNGAIASQEFFRAWQQT